MCLHDLRCLRNLARENMYIFYSRDLLRSIARSLGTCLQMDSRVYSKHVDFRIQMSLGNLIFHLTSEQKSLEKDRKA